MQIFKGFFLDRKIDRLNGFSMLWELHQSMNRSGNSLRESFMLKEMILPLVRDEWMLF